MNAATSLRPYLLAFLVIWLSGCTSLPEYLRNGFKVGPNYRTPPATVPASWIEADKTIPVVKGMEPSDVRIRSDGDDLSKWWKVFKDPVLDDLICHSYRQNLSLREAGFRVLQARAEFGVAVGNLGPQTQTMSGGYVRNATSIAQLLGGNFGSAFGSSTKPNIRRFFNQNAINFGLAWELDFWGRYRRAIEASAAELDASVDSYDDVLVTLLADVATNYVQFRVLEQQIEYLTENAKIQSGVVDYFKAKFDAGAKGSEIDYPQAKATLKQTLAQIPPTEIRLRLRTNRLCVLLGIPPEALYTRLGKASIPDAPKEVAAGIPAELVRRRPDVRRAERIAAAESARIGVAEAQLYPHISINGTVGWQAPKVKQLFTPIAFQGNYGPNFQWDVLNYGRNLNRIRFQRARFEEVVANYQNKVLTAAEEVENGIVTFVKSREQVSYLTEDVDEVKKALKVSASQFKGGTIDVNRLAVLELNLVQQQNLLAQAKGDVALGLIQVYRALGGGWEIRRDGCDAPGAFPPTSAVIAQTDYVPNADVRKAHSHRTDGAGFGAPRAVP